MKPEGKQRVAMNEATFRKVNEGMEVGQDPSGVLTFVCECGRLGCNKLIQLTRAQHATRGAIRPVHPSKIGRISDARAVRMAMKAHVRWSQIVILGAGLNPARRW